MNPSICPFRLARPGSRLRERLAWTDLLAEVDEAMYQEKWSKKRGMTRQSTLTGDNDRSVTTKKSTPPGGPPPLDHLPHQATARFIGWSGSPGRAGLLGEATSGGSPRRFGRGCLANRSQGLRVVRSPSCPGSSPSFSG